MVFGANGELEGRILVVHADRKTQRTIHKILGSTLCTIDVVDTLGQADELIAQNVPNMVVIDHTMVVTEPGELFVSRAAELGAGACLVLMNDPRGTDLPRLLRTGSLTNLLANPMPILAEELTATALKLLRGDIFGLEKYLSWGVAARDVVLDNANQRTEVVEALSRDLREYGLGGRVASLASLVADELLSNALYNAPVDSDGAQLRVADPRGGERRLTGSERVTLRYACDARYLAVEVTDLFGSLSRETILRFVSKGTRRSEDNKVDFRGEGAGLGVALAYSCCNHLVYNLHHGHRTEAIGLIDVRFKPNELGSMVSSFNVFSQGEQPEKGGS